MHLTEIFKEFIRKRLKSSSEETLDVFHGVIDDDEVERLYHVIWNPQVKLRRTGTERFSDPLLFLYSVNVWWKGPYIPDAFFFTLNQTVLRSFELHFFSFTRTHSQQVLRCDVRFSTLLFKSSCVLFFSCLFLYTLPTS